MAENTSIQWTDATVNFWTGCRKVSAGCKYCYMFRDKERYGQDPTVVIRTKPHTFNAALKWDEPKRIFTNSWSDFFIYEADGWRDDAWDIIRKTPHHTWQILTKRPERILNCLPNDWGAGWDNVWLGVSVENNSFDATDRIKYLEDIPAKTRFISFEPLISPLDRFVSKKIDWIILGGESGNESGKYRYRPCDLYWFDMIIEGYRESSPHTAIFVKQLGTYLSNQLGLKDRHGGDINEFPKRLQIREFPKSKKQTHASSLF